MALEESQYKQEKHLSAYCEHGVGLRAGDTVRKVRQRALS